MLSKSSRLFAAAVLFAGGIQLGVLSSASAATVPAPASTGWPEISQSEGQVHQVHRRRYRHYHRYRHGPRYRRRRAGHRHYYNGWWYATPWFLPPVVAPAPGYYGRRHVDWCLNRYRSYNPRTDMFLGYDGRYHRCRSPYRR